MFEREAAEDSSAYDWFMANVLFVDGSKKSVKGGKSEGFHEDISG